MEYSPNILRNSPTGRIHVIRGMEPLVQDTEPEQPDSSSVIQSRGAVCNTGVAVSGIVAFVLAVEAYAASSEFWCRWHDVVPCW